MYFSLKHFFVLFMLQSNIVVGTSTAREATRLFFGAIYLGNDYSSYAYSSRDDLYTDPPAVTCKEWSGSNYISMKTPTSILFYPNKTLHSFGHAAEETYITLSASNEHSNWYFFRRFKQMFNLQANIDGNLTLADEQGKTMKAINIFAAAIKFLKDDLDIVVNNIMADFQESWVSYNVIVPSTWSNNQTSLMKVAAKKAGIPEDQLNLVTESAAASTYFRETVDNITTTSMYLTLVTEGGSTDIVVNQIHGNDTIQNVYTNGTLDGTTVEDGFKSMLTDIVGNEVLQSFVAGYKAEWFTLLEAFEVLKRRVSREYNRSITIEFPTELNEIYKNHNRNNTVQNAIESIKKYKSHITIAGTRMIIDSEISRGLFTTPVSEVIAQLNEIPVTFADVKSISLAGDFSESRMLRESVTANFKKYGVNITVPPQPGLVVLKGAVMTEKQ